MPFTSIYLRSDHCHDDVHYSKSDVMTRMNLYTSFNYYVTYIIRNFPILEQNDLHSTYIMWIKKNDNIS